MRALSLLLLVPVLALGFLLGRALPDRREQEARPEPAALAGARSTDPLPARAVAVPGAALAAAPDFGAELGGAAAVEAISSRAEVRAEPAGTEPPPAEVEPVEVSDALRAALERFIASGMLEKRYAGDPHGLATFLAYAYLQVGDAYSAWDVARAYPDLGPQTIGEVGQLLKQQGDLASATDALLTAARLDPFNGQWSNELLDLDPAGALAGLRASMLEHSGLAAAGGAQREVELLLAAGQQEEALACIDALLASDWIESSTWDLLNRLPPEVAEERLRAHAADDTFGDARFRLAQLLESRGDRAGAIEALRLLLRDAPGRSEALWMLGNLDRDACIGALQERVAVSADAETWSALGDQLEAAGRREEAIDAWFAAFELYPSGGSIGNKLLEKAPERFLSMFEEQTQRSGYDEMWGDLADAYWRAGRRAEAQSAWEYARQLDPGDGEWTGKLQSLALGNDPLGGSDHYSPGFGNIDFSDLSSLGYASESFQVDAPFTYVIE